MNTYLIKDDIAIISVVYKNKVIPITIDKEDITIASSIQGKWILLYKDFERRYFYISCNLDKSIYLHKLVVNATADDKVFFNDKNYTNLRKSNLTINTYETDEAFREIKRKSYKNMSEKGKANFFRGMKENRYTKGWSDKLASTKKGEDNPQTVLNPNIVRTIREKYALREFTQQSLADYYQVGRTTIADIVNYRTWTEIGEHSNKGYRIYIENEVISINLKDMPIQEYVFTSNDIWKEDFVIELIGHTSVEYIFCQKIGNIKLYIEVRDSKKEFIHSFEVVFPEFLTPQHIHNYVIAQRKPIRYMTRHEIHTYMNIISTFLFGNSYEKSTAIEN